MTEAPESTEAVHINVQGEVVQAILDLIQSTCSGPQEALGVLAVALIKVDQLNAMIMGTEPNKEMLIEAVTQAINTAEQVVVKAH